MTILSFGSSVVPANAAFVWVSGDLPRHGYNRRQHMFFRAFCLALAAWSCHSAESVIVIGIDGLSTGGVRDAATPRIDDLMRRGAWSMKARAVIPTVSSPNWASMIMGAGPAQHGVVSNEWQPDKHDIPPVCRGTGGIYPTVFGILRDQRPDANIGIFHHWKDYARLVEPGAPSRMEHFSSPEATVDAAIAYWKAASPQLLFVHLDHVDHAGHEHGWGSAEYNAAVNLADKLIGRLVDAADLKRTAVIVTADHGGSGTKHGGLTMAELEIPWIAVGSGIRTGYEIGVAINTYDTAPTIAHLLGVRPPACWIARPVVEAFAK